MRRDRAGSPRARNLCTLSAVVRVVLEVADSGAVAVLGVETVAVAAEVIWAGL